MMWLHICAFINEVLRLGWPEYYVFNALLSIPRRHQSPFARYARHVGRDMRKFGFCGVTDISQLVLNIRQDSMQTRIVECMAPPHTVTYTQAQCT